MLEASFPDPAVFFDDGLALLVQQLKLDCALIVRRGELGSEVTWCHCEREDVREALGKELIDVLSQVALSHPQRTLVIQNLHAHKEAYLANVDPSPCIRSFAETVLWQDGQPNAVLMVMGHEPRHFLRHELALLVAVGDLFARTLEVENLKYELRVPETPWIWPRPSWKTAPSRAPSAGFQTPTIWASGSGLICTWPVGDMKPWR